MCAVAPARRRPPGHAPGFILGTRLACGGGTTFARRRKGMEIRVISSLTAEDEDEVAVSILTVEEL